MKINVKRIPEDGEHLKGTDPASILEVDGPDVHFTQDVKYDFHAQIQGNALLVLGKLSTPATLQCGRCLRTFDQPLRVDQFVYHQELTGEDYVDLTPQMREDIILELPQRALCDEDCKGLCPSCGVDLNKKTCRCQVDHGDLRWQGLENLKLK